MTLDEDGDEVSGVVVHCLRVWEADRPSSSERRFAYADEAEATRAFAAATAAGFEAELRLVWRRARTVGAEGARGSSKGAMADPSASSAAPRRGTDWAWTGSR